MPSLVRHQPIYSPEIGLYLFGMTGRPQDRGSTQRCQDLGCVFWKPLLTMYFDGSHYLSMTLLSTLRHRSTVCRLGGYTLSCLSGSHGSAMYWSMAMLHIPRAWECPPREDSFISDMRTLICVCRYPPILSSTPPSSSSTVYFRSITAERFVLFSVLRPSVPSDLAH